MRKDVHTGSRFPDDELPVQDGIARRLSELQGENPLVLHLSRGGFDPKAHVFVRKLADAWLEFKVAYTAVVVISPDGQLEINEFRDGVGAEFPFLADPARTVRDDLEIIEYTDPLHDPMVPHTFVLGPGLAIFRIYNGYGCWGRPTVEELHHDLREVLRETRPDFDLSAPGLREAWDAGEADNFLVAPIEGAAIRYTEAPTSGSSARRGPMEARSRNPIRILLVPGSTRGGSTNAAALRAAADAAQGDVTAVLFEGLADLQAFNPDDDYEPLPESVVELRRQIALADGVLFSTPEYMGTVPGSFKNLLEWTVGGPQMDGKPVSWSNVAPEGRGEGAQQTLETVLGYLGVRPTSPAGRRAFVPRENIGEDGRIEDAEIRAEIEDAVLTFARHLNGVGSAVAAES